MRPPACMSRGADLSATLEAIPHRCGNRLHRHARQFCATASSTTHSNFVRRQKNPGRSAPTICENVPAVASQQAATGYGILSETSGLGLSVGRDLPSVRAARQPNSIAADPVTAKTASRSASHRRNPLDVLIKAHLCRRRLPHLPRSLGRAAPAAPPPTISRRRSRSRSPAAAPRQSQQEAD